MAVTERDVINYFQKKKDTQFKTTGPVTADDVIRYYESQMRAGNVTVPKATTPAAVPEPIRKTPEPSPYRPQTETFNLPRLDVSALVAGAIKPSPVPAAAFDKAATAQPYERALMVPEQQKPGWQRAFDEAAWNSLLFGAAKPEYVPQGTAEKIASFLGGIYGMVPSLMAGGAASAAAANRLAPAATQALRRMLGPQIGARISEEAVKRVLASGLLWGGREAISGGVAGGAKSAITGAAKGFATGAAVSGLKPAVSTVLGKAMPEIPAQILGAGVTGGAVFGGRAALEGEKDKAWQEALQGFLIFAAMEGLPILANLTREKFQLKGDSYNLKQTEAELKAKGYTEFKNSGVWILRDENGNLIDQRITAKFKGAKYIKQAQQPIKPATQPKAQPSQQALTLIPEQTTPAVTPAQLAAVASMQPVATKPGAVIPSKAIIPQTEMTEIKPLSAQAENTVPLQTPKPEFKEQEHNGQKWLLISNKHEIDDAIIKANQAKDVKQFPSVPVVFYFGKNMNLNVNPFPGYAFRGASMDEFNYFLKEGKTGNFWTGDPTGAFYSDVIFVGKEFAPYDKLSHVEDNGVRTKEQVYAVFSRAKPDEVDGTMFGWKVLWKNPSFDMRKLNYPKSPVLKYPKAKISTSHDGKETVTVESSKPVEAEAVTEKPAKEPWQMTKQEFFKEYVFHGSPIPNITKTRPGTYFSDFEYAKGYAKIPGSHPGSGSIYAVRRSDIKPIAADEEDIFGQSEIEKGGSVRSGIEHNVIKVRSWEPHMAIVQQALAEGKPVPPEVLKEYPNLIYKPEVIAKASIDTFIAKVQSYGFRDVEEAQLAVSAKEKSFAEWKKDVSAKTIKNYNMKPEDIYKELLKKTENLPVKLEDLKLDLQLFGKKEWTDAQKERYRVIAKDLLAIKKKNMLPEYKDEISKALGEIDITLRKRSPKMIASLQKTKEWLEQNPGNPMPQRMLNKLDLLKKKPLIEMDFEDIEDIYKVVKTAEHLNNTKSKLIMTREFRPLKQDIETIKNNLKRPDLKTAKEAWDTTIKENRLNIVDRVRKVDALTPANIAMTVQNSSDGPVKKYFYDAFHEAHKEELALQYKANDDVREALSKVKDAENWSYVFTDKPTTVTVKLESGRNLTLTVDDRMAIYLHSRDPQNKLNLIKGGIRPERNESQLIKITENDIENIIEQMPAEERAVADAMAEQMKPFGDMMEKVQTRLYGAVVTPRRKNYWHMPRSKLDVEKEVHLRDKSMKFLLEEIGIVQERTGAVMPVVLRGAISQYIRSVDAITRYITHAIPLRNAKVILNDTEFRQLMAQNGLNDYLENLEKYIDEYETIYDKPTALERVGIKAYNNIIASIVGYNPGIMLKQLPSYWYAADKIDMKYLLKALITMPNYEEMKEHNIYIRDRIEGGSSTTEIGDIYLANKARRVLLGKTTLPERFTKGVKIFDMQAIGRIWSAAKMQIRDQKPGLKDEEFFEEVGKLVEEIINESQPSFAPHTKSRISRTKNLYLKAWTSFSNQRMKVYNMEYKARWEYAHSDKTMADKMKFARTMLVTRLAGPAMMLGIGALVDWAYKKNEKKEWYDYMLDYGEIVASYNFFIGPILSGLIYGIEKELKGESADVTVQDPLTSAISKAVNALIGLAYATVEAVTVKKYVSGYKEGELKYKTTAKRAVRDALVSTLSFLGYPAYNIQRIVEAATRWTSPETEFIIETLTKNPQSAQYYERLWEAVKAGDERRTKEAAKVLHERFGVDWKRIEQSGRMRGVSQEELAKAFEAYKNI